MLTLAQFGRKSSSCFATSVAAGRSRRRSRWPGRGTPRGCARLPNPPATLPGAAAPSPEVAGGGDRRAGRVGGARPSALTVKPSGKRTRRTASAPAAVVGGGAAARRGVLSAAQAAQTRGADDRREHDQGDHPAPVDLLPGRTRSAPAARPLEVAGQQVRGRAGVFAVARPGERRREALVEGLDGTSTRCARGASTKRSVSRGLLAASRRAGSAADRRRRARPPRPGRARGVAPGPLRCRPLDHAERPGERAGRVGDGDAGAGRAVVEREDFHKLGASDGRLRRLRAPRRAPPASCRPPRASVGRPPPPPSMCFAASRTSATASTPLSASAWSRLKTRKARPSSVEPSSDRRGFSCCGPVGEVAQVAARHAARLHDDDVALARADLEVGLGLLRRLLRLLARALELGPELFRLVGASAQSANASPAVTASMRRAPEPTEPSERITNGPISAVVRTCVPPQSSRETPSTSTTRTSSPYFSPKSIIAPSFRASSIGDDERAHRVVLEDRLVDAPLDRLPLLGRQRLRVREVEAQLVGPHRRAGLVDVVAEHRAQRLVQEVRSRVVRHRREAHAPRHDCLDAVAAREARALEQQRLVVVDPVGGAEHGDASRRPSRARRRR